MLASDDDNVPKLVIGEVARRQGVDARYPLVAGELGNRQRNQSTGSCIEIIDLEIEADAREKRLGLPLETSG